MNAAEYKSNYDGMVAAFEMLLALRAARIAELEALVIRLKLANDINVETIRKMQENSNG